MRGYQPHMRRIGYQPRTWRKRAILAQGNAEYFAGCARMWLDMASGAPETGDYPKAACLEHACSWQRSAAFQAEEQAKCRDKMMLGRTTW